MKASYGARGRGGGGEMGEKGEGGNNKTGRVMGIEKWRKRNRKRGRHKTQLHLFTDLPGGNTGQQQSQLHCNETSK